MSSKECRKCQLSKPFVDFPKGRDSNGLYYICKQCCTERSQAMYKAKDHLKRWIDATHSDVKSRAARKGIAFELTKDTFKRLFEEQGGECAYCKVKFVLDNTRHARRTSPSTDRIVPSGGYVESNVVLCCHRCNAIKSDASPEELKRLTDAVIALYEQRQITTASQSDPSQTV